MKVAQIRTILKKPYLTHADMVTISKNLIDILRIDPGDGSTIVGKIIGVSLLNDKLNMHFQKLDGTLSAIREPVDSFRGNPEKMRRHENGVFFINNKGEKVAILWFMQNYLYRIIEKTNAFGKWWKEFEYGEIDFEYVLGKFGEVFIPDAIGQKSIKYDTNIFIEHINEMTRQVSKKEKSFNGSPAEKQLLSRIRIFGENIKKIGDKYWKEISEINWDMRSASPERKEQLSADKTNLYLKRDAEVFREIYAFVQDPEIKDTLSKASIDNSFLPTQEEFSKNDSFRYPLFSHVRKAIRFQNEK